MEQAFVAGWRSLIAAKIVGQNLPHNPLDFGILGNHFVENLILSARYFTLAIHCRIAWPYTSPPRASRKNNTAQHPASAASACATSLATADDQSPDCAVSTATIARYIQ